MTKLNIVKHFKVEINGVYVIKLNHEPTLEVIQQLQAQFDGLSKTYNCKFVLLGNQMDILTNQELFLDERFIKKIKELRIANQPKTGPELLQ